MPSLINLDLKKLVNSICSEEGLENDFTNIWKAPTIKFNRECISNVRNSSGALGYSHRDIVSGAGHDASQISRVSPTGMIFIPCESGLSHDEAENIKLEQAAAGTDVLLNAVLTSAVS